MNRPVSVILSAILIITISLGCSGTFIQEDKTYLTPIPQETLRAYRFGSPIINKLQAVIAARIEINSPPHFKCVSTPITVSAEEMSLQKSHTLVAQPGSQTYDERPGDTRVWLVVFECDLQVFPPSPGTRTPMLPPPFHACSYVIIQAEDAMGSEVGGIECPCQQNGSCLTVVPTSTSYP
jgi:hypothetical protein